MELLILLSLLVVLPVLCAFIAFYRWWQGAHMRRWGSEALAIVDRKFERAGRHGIQYRAVVSFEDDQGAPHSAEISMDYRRWREYREGDTARVVYLPGRPQQAELGTKRGKEAIGIGLLAAAVFFISTAVVGVYLTYISMVLRRVE